MEAQKVTGSDAISVAALTELRAMDPDNADFLSNLIDMFVADMNLRVAAMREALTKRDVAALKRTAHALKGACGNFGADKLSGLCRKMEQLIPETVGQAADLMRQLVAEAERVRTALEQAKKAAS
jgi:HPt (histidine-containing phosphotransfer) domain-containing protein